MQSRYALPGKPVQCLLCPRACAIPEGGWGKCGVRGGRNGAGVIPYYGGITAAVLDPIEKKPLYHYRPGSSVFSVGFVGCNLGCPFCQNWRISQNRDAPVRYYSPEELIRQVQSAGADQIAYTYSEPLIHLEFLLDCMSLARKAGIANILVSNGCINPEPGTEVLSLTDAANIDLKSGSEETYRRVLGGDLPSALRFIAAAWEMKVHLELTTLVVPGLNDGSEEISLCAGLIAQVSPDIPWHLSAYHPDYLWKAPPTDPVRLTALAREAGKRLSYVYTGNIAGGIADTRCPDCGKILARRQGYRTDAGGLVIKAGVYRCAHCGGPAPFRGKGSCA
jgi:pyruvate formate lyase activating enzyme